MFNSISGQTSSIAFDFLNPGALDNPLSGTPDWYEESGRALFISLDFGTPAGNNIHLNDVEATKHAGAKPANTATTLYIDNSGTADGYWSIDRGQIIDGVYFDLYNIAFGGHSVPDDLLTEETVFLTIDQLLSMSILDLLDFNSKMLIDATPLKDHIVVGDFGSDVEAGPGDDTVEGGDGTDWIDGEGGADTLFGKDGDDEIGGGPGHQTTDGNDKIDGGAGIDTAFYRETIYQSMIVAAGAGWTVHRIPTETDTLTTIEIVKHAGGRFLLVGNGGFADADAAADRATQPGDIILFAVPPAETVIDESDATEDLSLVFAAATSVTVTTGSGDDTVATGSGEDAIDGGAGNDTLGGGSGDDTLTGGADADTFLFDTNLGKKNVVGKLDAGSNLDHITDFKPGTDTIALDRAIFTALDVAGLKKKQFFKGKDVGDAGRKALIAYDKGSGELAYVAGKKDVVFAILDGSPNKLGYADFDVVG